MGQPNESLTYLLQKAAKQALHRLEADLADLDLNARQFLLLALVEHDHFSQQALAHKLGLDPTAVVKLVDQLEARGVLQRSRNTEDRRQHRLTLTPSGHELLVQAAERQHKSERDLTRAIGARRNELRALLTEIVAPPPLAGADE
jgi:DNA-binding MarR family transcriptional regulator